MSDCFGLLYNSFSQFCKDCSLNDLCKIVYNRELPFSDVKNVLRKIDSSLVKRARKLLKRKNPSKLLELKLESYFCKVKKIGDSFIVYSFEKGKRVSRNTFKDFSRLKEFVNSLLNKIYES